MTDEPEVEFPTQIVEERKNSQQTAKKAVELLRTRGFIAPSPAQKRNLLVAFAKKNRVVYGKAFDVIKVTEDKVVNLDDPDELEQHLDKIVLYEIKATNRSNIGIEFQNYFFALTTAELLVAQNLREQYRFIFVNTLDIGEPIVLSLKGVFEKAKAIYPTWSISF